MKYQDLSLFKLPKSFRGRSVFIVQLWWFCEALFFNLSPQFMYPWRRFILRLFGAKIGKNVIIRPTVKVTYPWKLIIGNNSWIGDGVVLYCLGEIEIGSDTVISQKTYLCTGSHDFKKKNFPIYAKKIVIKNECWLATDVYVGPGVTIGKGTIIGARSSVYKNLPSGKICIGNPAKIVNKRVYEKN